ncbi:hypothetical protein P691DRAFT_690204, partial [Macrolepiota fuliginosa MF-IS2]
VWLICSCLEPHFIATFKSPEVLAVTHQEELIVSQAINNEIAKYLTDEFSKIGEEHDFQVPWLHECDIGTLVNLSSGLFIYANTMVHFIGDHNSLGPEAQLQTILTFVTSAAKGSLEHPLSKLDLFYFLIIECIPAKILWTIQWILLATNVPYIGTNVIQNRQLLGLLPSQFLTACCTLHSMMKIEKDNIIFYHTSFMDFMQDPQHLRQFCIWKDPALALQIELTQRLQAVCNDPDVELHCELCVHH